MNPPECKTCGRRTDLSDMEGNPRCAACRAVLWPHVYGDERPWLPKATKP